MPTNIPSGYAQAAIEYTGQVGTAPYVTTFGVNLSGASFDQWVDQANDIFDAWVATWQTFTSDGLIIERCRLTVALGPDVGSVVSTRPAEPGGATGTDRVPTSMSIIANKLGGSIGRRNRGRSFIPGLLTDGAVDEQGYITEATRESYEDLWANFRGILALGGATSPATPMVILHNDMSAPTPVLGGGISPQVGWIRKRIR